MTKQLSLLALLGMVFILLPSLGHALEREASWVSADTGVGRYCAFGHMDGDGLPELAVLNGNLFPFNQTTTLRVYRNLGGALEETASWETSYTSDEDAYNALAWGDVDGDGRDELAVDIGQRGVRIFANVNGVLEMTPSWRAAETPASFQYGYDRRVVAFADVDQDGDQDLLSAWYEELRIYRNEGGVLAETAHWRINWRPPPGNQGSHLWNLAIGHIDDDAYPDLALNYQTTPFVGGSPGIGIFLNRRGSFASQPDQYIADFGNVALADVDGDGDDDLGVRLSVYANQGGVFAAAPVANAEFDSPLWADLDGDGASDAYLPRNLSDHVFLETSSGVGPYPQWVSADQEATGCACVGDVDGDGKLDVARVTYEDRFLTNGQAPVRLHLNRKGFGPSGPPLVAMAGFMGTDLAMGTQGTVSLVAVVSNPGPGRPSLAALAGGAALEVPLVESVGHLSTFRLSAPAMPAATGQSLLGLRASDSEWYSLEHWPYLTVLP